MNLLRKGLLVALGALPLLVVGGGGCSSSPSDSMNVPLGQPCASDDDCETGDFCDQSTNVCTAEHSIALNATCNDDLDCLDGCCDPNGLVCVVCGAAGSVPTGGTCVDDAECDPGDYCSNAGICEIDPYAGTSATLGGSCYEDADCASDEYCDIQTDTCVN
jgi:hypothetical protein